MGHPPKGRRSPGVPWVRFDPLGPIALVSRNDNVASREIGGGAGIAGACKQVGGYARSVDECIPKWMNEKGC